MKINQKTYIWGLIGVLVFITFYPLLKVGIVTGDDLGYMLWPMDRLMEDSRYYAEGTGRFYFLFALWVYKVPYFIDSQIYFQITFVVPHLIAFGLFVSLICRFFKSEYVGMLTAVLACSLFQIYGGHTATAGYPFYFTLSFSMILGSVHLLLSYFKSSRYYLLLLSSILFGLSTLLYETYLIYYLLFFILIIRRYPIRILFLKGNIQKWSKELLPFVFFGITYLVIYFYYNINTASGYQGNSFSSELTFQRFMQTIGNMAFYSLPLTSLYDYRFFLTDFSLAKTQTFEIWKLVFTESGIDAYIKGFMVVILVWWMNKLDRIYLKRGALIGIFFITILFIFLPHLPLSLSEKYTSSIQNIYVTTYFSFFAVVVLCVTLYLILKRYSQKWRWLNWTFITLSSIFLFVTTLSIQYTNQRVTDDLMVAQNRLQIMESMLKELFIESGSPVYVADLHQSTSYFSKPITRQGNPFSSFAKERNGLEIQQYLSYEEFYEQYSDSVRVVYTLYFSQASKTGDCYMAILRTRGDQLEKEITQNSGDSLWVGYYSPYKKFGVGIATKTNQQIFIHESPMHPFGSYHIQNLNFLNRPKVCIFKIKGEGVYPNSITISNQLFPHYKNLLVGRFPSKFEKAWVKHIMMELDRNKELKERIQEKAQQTGNSYKSALKADASWILYTEHQ